MKAKSISYLITPILFVIGLLPSCKNIYGEIINDDVLLNKLYSKATDTVLTSSNKVLIVASAYRNFMPGGPIPRDTKLVVSVDIVDFDSVTLENRLSYDQLYVIMGNTIWKSSPYIDNTSYLEPFQDRVYSNGGPEWRVGELINVVLEITDKHSLNKYYLISQDVEIQKEV